MTALATSAKLQQIFASNSVAVVVQLNRSQHMFTTRQIQEQEILNEYNDDIAEILVENRFMRQDVVHNTPIICYHHIHCFEKERYRTKTGMYLKPHCSRCDTQSKNNKYTMVNGEMRCNSCSNIPSRRKI